MLAFPEPKQQSTRQCHGRAGQHAKALSSRVLLSAKLIFRREDAPDKQSRASRFIAFFSSGLRPCARLLTPRGEIFFFVECLLVFTGRFDVPPAKNDSLPSAWIPPSGIIHLFSRQGITHSLCINTLQHDGA